MSTIEHWSPTPYYRQSHFKNVLICAGPSSKPPWVRGLLLGFLLCVRLCHDGTAPPAPQQYILRWPDISGCILGTLAAPESLSVIWVGGRSFMVARLHQGAASHLGPCSAMCQPLNYPVAFRIGFL